MKNLDNTAQKSYAQSIRNSQHRQRCEIIETPDKTPYLPESTAMKNSGKTGDICPICGKNRRREAVICGIKYSFHVMCECEVKREKAERQKLEDLEKMQKIEKLRALSLLGERFKNVAFETTQTGANSSFDAAFNRCKKYCEIYQETVKNGYGIYLFGDKGVGKTHLTACMANFLISKCVPVIFTNLFEISKAVESTFNRSSSQSEQLLIQKFSNIDVLFFDDLGTEIFTKTSGETWLQGLLFDLINKRYNNRKATVFSSNYSLNSLINERGIMEKTVERISEMTSGAVMKIAGKSLRNALKNQAMF